MLTDSASAIKYWYFIRLMGREPSHLAVECALKTHPNFVVVAEECKDRNESIKNIVDNLCDIIQKRAEASQNYGCILIPEGLLKHVSTFNNLMTELGKLSLSHLFAYVLNGKIHITWTCVILLRSIL